MILTDKQLNAFAANAIGLVMQAWGFCDDHGVTIGSERDGPIYWSPLTNDSDAFRLATDLGIDILWNGAPEGKAVAVLGGFDSYGNAHCHLFEYYDGIPHLGDKYSAARRAIVRAAADMGKEKLRERGRECS